MAEIDDRLLSAVATALLVEPRSSFQALAKAAGISRATLYRATPTREKLVELLEARSIEITKEALAAAALDPQQPYKGLAVMTARILEHREIFTFHFMQGASAQQFEHDPSWHFFDTAMEGFFLECQRVGTLRIDQTPAWLQEVYGCLIFSAARAIKIGTLAPASAHAFILSSFFEGAASK